MSSLTKTDRKQITGMITKLNEIRTGLDEILAGYYDNLVNLSEKDQESEMGVALEETVEYLETTAQSTDELIDTFTVLGES